LIGVIGYLILLHQMPLLAHEGALNNVLRRKQQLVARLATLPIAQWLTEITAFVNGARQIHAASTPLAQCILIDLELAIEQLTLARVGRSVTPVAASDGVMTGSCAIEKMYDQRIANISALLDTAREGDGDLADRVTTYVMTHLDAQLSAASLARVLGSTPSLISRAVRRCHSCSIRRHLIQLRLMAAFNRIAAGEKIEAAMCFVGFRNRTTFFREFRKSFKVLPSQVQRRGRHERPRGTIENG
jgi:AraC-like DNA-binding protein